jgi:hypothetical protein
MGRPMMLKPKLKWFEVFKQEFFWSSSEIKLTVIEIHKNKKQKTREIWY